MQQHRSTNPHADLVVSLGWIYWILWRITQSESLKYVTDRRARGGSRDSPFVSCNLPGSPSLIFNILRLYLGSLDLINSIIYSRNANIQTPFAYSLAVRPLWCPKALVGSGLNGCTQASTSNNVEFPLDDNFNVEFYATMGLDGTISSISSAYPTTVASISVTNLLQFLHAAVRLDLGNDLPNNILTNASVSEDPTVGSGGILYSGFGSVLYPLPKVTSAVINASFQCRFKSRKSWLEVLLSVFVGTFTLFSTGWTILTITASFLAERRFKKIEEKKERMMAVTTVAAAQMPGYSPISRNVS